MAIAAVGALARSLPVDVPVDPDAPEARQWLLDELARAEYQSARPTWFDLLASGVWEWINSLQFGEAKGPPALGLAVVVALVVVGLVVAFLIFGLPRLNRRSAVTGKLFGDDDDRSAAAIRASATAAAARGDYSSAIAEMFRSIARGLAERTVLTTSPGTTAHDFGARVGAAFPASATAVRAAATTFDSVRYLGRSGTKEQYDDVAALERALRAARPVLAPMPGPVPTPVDE